MNDTDRYILNAIRIWVWSGFYTPEDVDRMIDDILDKNADESMLRAAVFAEFEKKAVAESAWPEETDCDRLDQAFEELNARGIIALQNAGYEQSDGHTKVSEVLHSRGRKGIRGYCFYHGQDVNHAIDGGELWLAFGGLGGEAGQQTGVGRAVNAVLEQSGFDVEWDGNPETRLKIPRIDWKRR